MMTTGPNPQHPPTGTTTPHNPCTPETTTTHYFPSDTDNILREVIQKLDASQAELTSLTSDMQTLNAWCRSLQTENDHWQQTSSTLLPNVKFWSSRVAISTSREQLMTSPTTSTSWKPSQDETTSGSSMSVRPLMKTSARVQGKWYGC